VLFIYNGIYLATKKNEILSFADKWNGTENRIFGEVSQVQKTKGCMFSLICGIQTLYKYKQYYEMLFTLREDHIRERVKEGS
jgi:hypothetical protein